MNQGSLVALSSLNLFYKILQMKNFKTISICLFLFFTGQTALNAQVKIGDNPNTINVNSLLELESTNKGFLPPKVALTSVSSPSPLAAPVPSGMIVYNSGGTINKGTYQWNGAKWQSFSMDNAVRNNFVLVKSAADFPAPVNGVITLVAGTLYEINGTVTLSDKIDLNGCGLQGDDAGNDKLIYTGGTELFTGANVGNITFLSLTAPSGKIFNINGGGLNKNLIVQNCFFIGCNTVGTIENVGGTVFFSTVAYFYNTNGLTFQNDNNVILNNTLWDISNYNVYEKFIGTFNVIQILGGDRLVSSANTATATHISGITSVVAASIKVVMFVGTGTYVTGSFSNSWEIEASGLNTEKDDVASGNLYVSTSASTPFSAVNSPVKVSGTTSATSLFRVTSTLNNRLTYSGAKSRRFHVICSLSSIASSNNKNFTYYIAKNGVVLPESKQLMKLSSQVDRGSLTLSCNILMTANDYIEVWVENNTDATSLVVESLNLAIK